MRQLFGRPWFMPGLMFVVAALFLVWGLTGRGVVNFIGAAILVYFAARFIATTRIPSRSVAGVQGHLSSGGVVVYWRPGCQYCARLVRALGAAGRERLYWVNIWDEPEAAERLRSYHRGLEIVPTMVVGDEHFVVKDAADLDRARALVDRTRPLD